MENQPPLGPTSTPFSPPALSTAPPSGEWPTVPPAPALVKPDVPPATPEPPALSATAPALPVAAAAATVTEPETGRLPAQPATAEPLSFATIADESPTVNIPAGTAAESAATSGTPPLNPPPLTPPRRTGRGTVPPLSSYSPDDSPIVALQRSVRRQQAYARNPREDLVWQPRFAYSSALIILLALAVVSLPLWLVLYRISDPLSNNGAGPKVADLMALCMMLLGGFLTGAAAWVIIIEMRGRVRMVDTLAKTGEREAMAAPEIPVLDAPLENLMLTESVGRRPAQAEGEPMPLATRIEAQQVSAAQTLEASSKLLSSFSSVLRSFGQLPAQVAMLAVALALFVGATVLSLN